MSGPWWVSVQPADTEDVVLVCCNRCGMEWLAPADQPIREAVRHPNGCAVPRNPVRCVVRFPSGMGGGS